MLRDCSTFLFDLDGTVYCGNKPMSGGAALIAELKNRRFQVKYISNNSSHEVDFVREKLERMGIQAENAEIITPLSTVGCFLGSHFGKSQVFVLGTKALAHSIAKSGHRIVQGLENCDVVVIGRDIEITYQKIELACIHLQRGAACIICNSDTSHPGELGYLVPETGAFYSLVKTVCNPKLCLEIGKPDPFLYTYAFGGADPKSCVMVGDNVDTDICGAKRANCTAVLLRGPLSAGREDEADFCIDCLPDILNLLG